MAAQKFVCAQQKHAVLTSGPGQQLPLQQDYISLLPVIMACTVLLPMSGSALMAPSKQTG
jgi:hypothetical protein